MLFEVVGKGFAHGLVDGARHFGVSQLGFCLSLELRFGHFHADDGREAFAEVFAADFYLCFFYLLCRCLFGVFLQDARQCLAEPDEVRAAFDGVDVVDIAVYVFAVGRVVHNGYVDG